MLAGPMRTSSRLHLRAPTTYGFLLAKPDIPQDPNSVFQWRHVGGLPVERVQYCEVSLSGAGVESQQHLVLMAHLPPLAADTCEAIAGVVRRAFPSAVLSFIRALEEYNCEATSEADPGQASAAVAEAMRAGSLDDVERVRVRLGRRAFDVHIRWVKEGRHAEAEVIESAG